MKTNVLYNQDCLEGMKSLSDNSVDLIVIDPPYPINTNNGTNRFSQDGWIDGSSDTYNKEWYENFVNVIIQLKRILKDGHHFYCFVDEKNLFKLKPYLDKELEFKKVIVWHKVNFGLGYHYRNIIEYVFLYSKNKSNIHINNKPNFFRDTKDNIKGHPTVKSHKMISWLIKNSTQKGDIVCDCYMGSGSTAIACLKNKRKYIGYEINKKYYDIAQKRINDYNKQVRLFGE